MLDAGPSARAAAPAGVVATATGTSAASTPTATIVPVSRPARRRRGTRHSLSIPASLRPVVRACTPTTGVMLGTRLRPDQASGTGTGRRVGSGNA